MIVSQRHRHTEDNAREILLNVCVRGCMSVCVCWCVQSGSASAGALCLRDSVLLAFSEFPEKNCFGLFHTLYPLEVNGLTNPHSESSTYEEFQLQQSPTVTLSQ